MIIEPDLITFPTHKIYPNLDIGELEEEIYYDDEIIEYELAIWLSSVSKYQSRYDRVLYINT